MLFALVLVLAQALAGQANVARDVNALCAGKRVELTTFEQLTDLAAPAHLSDCPAFMRDAILELWAIIEKDRDNLCTVDAADTLRAYYNQYLDNAAIREDNKRQLPEPLRKFVIGYGLRMSNLCKKQLIKVLSEDARNLLEPRDFEQLDALTDEHSALAEIFTTMNGPEDIFLPGDLGPLFNKNGDTAPLEKLFIQTASAAWLRKLQSVCQRRFKPIYEPLMVPLVRLANMGFNYNDEFLEWKLASEVVRRHTGQWARIVFMCESLAGVHIVADPDNEESAETGATQTAAVKIISKEEAIAAEGATFEVDSDGHEFAQFEYVPEEQIVLDDMVLDASNGKFTKALDAFKVGQSEAELAKRAMIQKGVALLKSQLGRGRLSLVVSAAYRSVTSADANSAGSAIVRSLDEVAASAAAAARPGVNIGEWLGNAFVIVFVGIIFIVLAAAVASLLCASFVSLGLILG